MVAHIEALRRELRKMQLQVSAMSEVLDELLQASRREQTHHLTETYLESQEEVIGDHPSVPGADACAGMQWYDRDA